MSRRAAPSSARPLPRTTRFWPVDLRDRPGSALLWTRARAGPARADLQPVLSLNARPVRVVDLPAFWPARPWPAGRFDGPEAPSHIATLPIGYGDGWARSLSNRAEALVRGPRRPYRRDRGDGRDHGRRDPRTRAAGRRRRLVHAHRRAGRPANCSPRSGTQNGTTISWNGDVPGDCPGCTIPRPDTCPSGTSRNGAAEWPGSNSGTATSASWKSTRSSTPRTRPCGCPPGSAARSNGPAVTR